MAAPGIDKKALSRRSYTEPLGLMARLRRPSMKLDMVPVLDLLVIALLFSLLFTRYVMMPGVRIDLPDSGMQMEPSDLPVVVLTIGNRGMLFFDGAVFELNSIQSGFNRYMDNHRGRDVVLLVKTEGSMDVQSLMKLFPMALEAGFVRMNLVGESEAAGETLMPGRAGAEGFLNRGFPSDL